MNEFKMISDEEAMSLSIAELLHAYNDVVETLWDYQQRLDDLRQENDSLWTAYDELTNKLYG